MSVECVPDRVGIFDVPAAGGIGLCAADGYQWGVDGREAESSSGIAGEGDGRKY